MVQGLAAQSGGLLRIHSEPNVGTVVELWLPRATTAPAAVVRLPQASGPSATTPCTVLIVDDDNLVMTGTAAMVFDLGHTAVEAHSGAEALNLLNSGLKVDVVLTDHAMPAMTGLQLAENIQQRYPGLPVILRHRLRRSCRWIPPPWGSARLAKPLHARGNRSGCIQHAVRFATAQNGPMALSEART